MGDKKRKLSQNVREEEPVVEPEGKKVKQDKTAKKEEKKKKENTGKSQSRGGEEGVEVSVNGSGEKFEEKEDVEEKAEKKEKKDKEDKKVKKVKKNKTDKIEKKERKDKNEKKRKTDDVDENEGENDDGGVEVPAAHEESADAMDVDAQPTKDDEGKAQEKKEKKEKKKEKKAKKEKREPQEEQSQSQPEPAEASQAQEEPEQDSQKNARFIAFVGNLPYSANTDSIKAHFTKNPPASIRVATEKDKPTKCRGFAFIEFENFDRMKTCLKLYHHSTFDDGKYPPRRINVELTAGGGGKSDYRKSKISAKNQKLNAERQRSAKQVQKEKDRKNRNQGNGDQGQGQQQQQGYEQENYDAAGEDAGDYAGVHPSRRMRMQ